MIIDVKRISGVADFRKKKEKDYDIFETNDKVFLVLRKNTMEVRTDSKLKDLLIEKYESVMESRYFGRGGIEVVLHGQLDTEEINDLIRLSYNLSKKND